MLSKSLQDALNEQIKNELYSSYLYLSMAAYYEAQNLKGFANWMHLQSQEEVGHAMKFFEFINDRGGRVSLKAIDQPPAEWKSNINAFEDVLAHEQKVTAMINKLYDQAMKENDYPTQVMLHWFIEEQVEEEKSAAEVLANLKLIEAHGTAVLMLDHQLAKRGKGS